jgi:hypothetical protein
MTTQIVFGRAGAAAAGAGVVPVVINEGSVSETISESASNQATTAVCPALGGDLVCVVAPTVNVYVAVGTAPNAITGTTQRHLVTAGSIYGIGCKAGDKAAVVTA